MSTEKPGKPVWRRLLRSGDSAKASSGPSTWSMGILNDTKTIEVPGSVLLLAQHHNRALGLRNIHVRTSHSSIPTGFPVSSRRPSTSLPDSLPPDTIDVADTKKTTADGNVILEPQPEESANDPLNWPSWRRDAALLSLGFYCMIGGGITPLIAAGFTDVAETYHVEVESVALTTGLYMMGLGLGSVIASPTAILYGKRPVYLGSVILFVATLLWAAWSPTFNSLLVARVFQGIAVSPVECLPSATIAEIFFLHERAFRIGIYTLLLLGGKNLVPLVSAAVIGRLGWPWVFWIVAMIVGLNFVSLFLFVPETFWDRTPEPKSHHPSKRPSFLRRLSSHHRGQAVSSQMLSDADLEISTSSGHTSKKHKDLHVGFVPGAESNIHSHTEGLCLPETNVRDPPNAAHPTVVVNGRMLSSPTRDSGEVDFSAADLTHSNPTHDPTASGIEQGDTTHFTHGHNHDAERNLPPRSIGPVKPYTQHLRQQPATTFTQQLKPYHGRLNHDNWFKVMIRPFVLFAYPAILWSSAVYACSIGWLIVISESIALIYRDPTSYNFSALQTGLVYVSPFVGGILGTGVAGKISDIIVKAMARRNGGLYEPEFRLVMAIPILITTCIGLMGFGWSAEEKNHWMIPTAFFGIISFGCSLGSTTSITFAVDSYRQYAGEALVTLNFAKNIFHGLVFSLFVTHWLKSDGPKMVYIWIGIIQLILMLFTIPLYIYGKRARMWTVRANLLEKF